MNLLVSPYNIEEARQALRGGADIVDIKNPREGSLGANFPWVIGAIVSEVGEKAETSATIGDLSFKPGQASQAAFGASLTGVGYVKAGIAFQGREEALELSRSLVRAVEERAKVILAAYADYGRAGTMSPEELLPIAVKARAHGVMVDTLFKEGKGLFSYFSEEGLSTFVEEAHSYNLVVALAGSLEKEHLSRVRELGTDIAGVRGAACSSGDRVKGRISASKVRELKRICTEF